MLNEQLFLWLNLGPQAPAWVLKGAVFGASTLPAVALVGLFAALLAGPRWRRVAVQAFVGMALAYLVARGLGKLFPMPRPHALGLGHQWIAHRLSPSWPSTHATVSMAFAVALWFGAPSAWARWVGLLAAVWIGWARIAVGVHFPIDIVSGFLLGALCALAAVRASVRVVPAWRPAR